MPASYEALLEDHVDIAAEPAQVWEVVRDVRRMSEWSPQVDSTRLRTGFDQVGLGAEFTNKNSHGRLPWVTHGRIVRYDPEREIAFRIEENWVIWSFTLQPYDGAPG